MANKKISVKCVVTIPIKLNEKIKIYQSRKAINVKKEAIVQMLSDFITTEEGKELTH